MRTTDSAHKPGARYKLPVVAHPTAVRDARGFVAHRLRAWGIDGETADRAVLVTSELVTNAVRLAEGFVIWVGVSWNFGNPLIEVWDPYPEMLPERRDAADTDESGRGLALVETLAHRWGVEPEPSGGKIVFAVVV